MTSLSNLNDHLFAQLDRLNKNGLSADEVETEAKRAKAIVELADQVTSNARTSLEAAKLFANHGRGVLHMLPQIGSNQDGDGNQ